MGRFNRVVADIKPQCPAGEAVGEAAGGTGCHCRITRDVIESVINPSVLNAYCMGDYTQCPVWQRDKEEAWADKTNRPLFDREGNFRIPEEQDRERAQVLKMREAEEAARG